MVDEVGGNDSLIVETTADRFEQDVIERSRTTTVVVDFWATWCQPCRMLGPVLEKLAAEYGGKFVLVKAETEQVPQWAAQFGVQSIPAVYAVRDGEAIDFFVGVLPEPQLREWIDRVLPTASELLVADAKRLAESEPELAEAKFREAISLAPNQPAAKIALAELLLAAERLEECGEIFSELEQRGYLEPEAEKLKAAWDLRRRGASGEAIDACRAEVEAHPDDPAAKWKLAQALASEQQYQPALEICLELLELDRHGLGESARTMMIEIFRVLPEDSELTAQYRRKLSAALY